MSQAAAHTTHNHSHSGSILSVYESVDPTRTVTLRARYAKEMRKRFRELRGMILDAVVNKDVFGLSEEQFNIQANADAPVSRGQFAFPRHRDKVSAFMEWLNRQIDRNILEVRNRQRIGASIDETWQNIFIEDSYKRGVIRGNQELRKAAFPDVQSLEDRGGMAAVMGQPFHADRLGVLYTRAYNELKGITDNMDQQISRVLTQGLADGDNPRLLGRKLNAIIKGGGADLGLTDSLGRFIPAERRAQILARTEVIRAHHQGMMQEYRNWGVEGVEVQAEFRTAGDDRVCWDCDSLQGTVYSLDEAQNLIPVHPMCRCIVLPTKDGVAKGSPTREDAEFGNISPEYHEDYTTYKNEAKAFFDGKNPNSIKNLGSADVALMSRSSELAREIEEYASNNFPHVAEALAKWQTSPGSAMPTRLRQLASQVERNAGDVIGWSSPEILAERLAKVSSGLSREEYLRARAFNQVFMELAELDNLKYYRGVGGPSGRRLKESFTRDGMRRTKVTFDETALSGWTPDEDMATEFAGQWGFWIEDTVKRQDVFLHHSMLNSFSGQFSGPAGNATYLREFENLLFGGKRTFNLDNIKWYD